MKQKCVLTGMVTILLLTAVASAEPRTWTDSTGRFNIEGEFVSFQEGIVTLKKSSGQMVSVPLETAVLTGEGTVEQLERKGYKPVQTPEGILSAAQRYGVQTPAKVLSLDELSGRLITDPTDSAQAAVDYVWQVIEMCSLNNGKEKPPVKCFTSILDGGVMLNGYYRNGEVFINADLAPFGVLLTRRTC